MRVCWCFFTVTFPYLYSFYSASSNLLYLFFYLSSPSMHLYFHLSTQKVITTKHPSFCRVLNGGSLIPFRLTPSHLTHSLTHSPCTLSSIHSHMLPLLPHEEKEKVNPWPLQHRLCGIWLSSMLMVFEIGCVCWGIAYECQVLLLPAAMECIRVGVLLPDQDPLLARGE